MTPQELLLKAADEIARRGHAKGRFEHQKTRAVCAYGAMTAAATDGETANYANFDARGGELSALVGQAAQLLARSMDNPWNSYAYHLITGFNDDPKTTGEDVILAMKKAATDG